jgi:hypothetical protein
MTDGNFSNPYRRRRSRFHRTDQGKDRNSHRLVRTGLINPQVVEMPRIRPAIEAGLMVLLEAAGPYMRPVLAVSKQMFCLSKSCSIATCRAHLVRLVRMNLLRTIPDSGRDRQPAHAFYPSAQPFQARPGEQQCLLALLAHLAHFFLDTVQPWSKSPSWARLRNRLGGLRRIRRLRRTLPPQPILHSFLSAPFEVMLGALL